MLFDFFASVYALMLEWGCSFATAEQYLRDVDTFDREYVRREQEWAFYELYEWHDWHVRCGRQDAERVMAEHYDAWMERQAAEEEAAARWARDIDAVYAGIERRSLPTKVERNTFYGRVPKYRHKPKRKRGVSVPVKPLARPAMRWAS